MGNLILTGSSTSSSLQTGAGDVLDLPLVQSSDPIMTFRGEITMPATIKQDAGVGSSLNVSVDGNSMYYASFYGDVAKTTLPANGTGSASLTVGWQSPPGSAGINQNHSAILEYEGNSYASRYSTYTDEEQTVWIQRGTTSLGGWTTLGGANGQNMRLLTQGFYRIPTEWQSLLGGPVATLGCRLNRITNCQCGYGFATFDPADVGSGAVPVTPLLNYTYANALEPVDSSHPGWAAYPKNANGGTDLVSSTNAYSAGCFIVPGSRTLLFISAHGYGVADNGCRPGSSVHADPNRVQCVAYDLRDLVDVKNGTQQPYQPRPYAWWEWNYGGVHWNECVGGQPLSGNWGTYCPVKNRWYMCADFFGDNIHTYDVVGL